MSLITDKLVHSQHDEGKSGSLLTPLIIALIVIMIALFIGEMLFGKNSVEVYLSLEKNQKTLEKKIYHLKSKNAALQKKYFELKNVMPNED